MKLFAEEGWHGVDVVLEAGSSAVCASAVDNQGRLRLVISMCSKSIEGTCVQSEGYTQHHRDFEQSVARYHRVRGRHSVERCTIELMECQSMYLWMSVIFADKPTSRSQRDLGDIDLGGAVLRSCEAGKERDSND